MVAVTLPLLLKVLVAVLVSIVAVWLLKTFVGFIDTILKIALVAVVIAITVYLMLSVGVDGNLPEVISNLQISPNS